VQRVAVVVGDISARAASPRCNIHARWGPKVKPERVYFFVDPVTVRVSLSPVAKPIGGRRALLGPPHDRWLAIAATPGNAPRISDAGTPDAVDATPPAAASRKEVRRN
jgi:hypothetical protein